MGKLPDRLPYRPPGVPGWRQLVLQGPVEVDSEVRTVAEGLVAGMATTAERHLIGVGISRPSTSVRRTGPDTRYGPFSLGVIVTSAIGGALLSQ
jgi:hypothetical protein